MTDKDQKYPYSLSKIYVTVIIIIIIILLMSTAGALDESKLQTVQQKMCLKYLFGTIRFAIFLEIEIFV